MKQVTGSAKFAWLIQPWRWMQPVPSKFRLTFSGYIIGKYKDYNLILQDMTPLCTFIHSFINRCGALCLALASSSISYFLFTRTTAFLVWVIRPSQGRYRHTDTHTHTDFHALSWIRIHNPSIWVSEDNSCLRSRSHCDRPLSPW
jgi:hypothetical protein